jgi:Flp pilus assembly pilin Flp
MKTMRKLLTREDGQGLVEYTLIVLLVAFAFWVSVRSTTLGASLTDNWNTVVSCVAAPFSSCTTGS